MKHLGPIVVACAACAVVVAAGPVLGDLRSDPVIPDVLPSGSLQQVMQGLYDAQSTQPVDHPVDAVIVPHHLTAAASIARGIGTLTERDPRTVVVLSPDHFDACDTPLCTTRGLFETVLGDVRVNDAVVDRLGESSFVSVQDALFGREHGIAAVLPFIVHLLPKANVVPIVVSDGWHERRDDIVSLLERTLDDSSVLVVSSDFSHYLPLRKADEMDEATMETFFAADIDGIARLKNPDQSDCPACLWLLTSVALDREFFNPSVLSHTNSARILGDERAPETTSHFAIVFYRNDALSPTDLAVGGDVTMTRRITTPRLHPAMAAFWSGSGSRLVNLEGPVASFCAPDRGMFTFCNAEKLWVGMRDLATHWGVFNNHMFDQHAQGLAETQRIIDAHGETWVGDEPVQIGNGVVLVTLTALMNPVADHAALDRRASYERVLQQIADIPPEQFVVVLTHAGTEYAALSSASEIDELRSFVDAGADAVLASHTHVIGDMEIYRNAPIFHGIGNFIFDQFDAVSTSTAMAVRLRKEGGRVLFQTFRSAE